MTKQRKNTSRTVKHLIQSAAKGNFESSYQLYKNYSEGKNVERKDEALAKKYFNEVENSLIGNRLSLKSLQLTEFRRFHDLSINFEENVTVIIGDNGAGKTSIADAISKTLSWFNNNLIKEDVNGRPVTPADINVDAGDYAEVISKFQFDKSHAFEAILGRVVPGYSGDSPTDVTRIKQFGAMYRHTANNSSIMIPILAFYSVKRSDFNLTQSVSENALDETTSNRFSALSDALEGSGKLDDFSELYIELVNLAEGENTKEVKELRSKIRTLEETINDVYEGIPPLPHDPYIARLSSLKEDLASSLKLAHSPKYQRHLDFVNLAIDTLVPEVKSLEVDRSTGKPRLLVDNFGNKVNISQLSQGQKMLVALTGDLARRLVTLNPESDNPLHGHGIIVIDEVELHLHPKWQQEILIGLQATFPNLQFIVTTHSPQVLSTVDKGCIRILRFDSDGFASIDTPQHQTKGVRSSDVLEQIMSTFSIPPVDEANWLADYSALVSDNKWTTEEGQKLFDNIVEHFGTDHPEIIKIKGDIRVQEFKLRAKKLKGA